MCVCHVWCVLCVVCECVTMCVCVCVFFACMCVVFTGKDVTDVEVPGTGVGDAQDGRRALKSQCDLANSIVCWGRNNEGQSKVSPYRHSQSTSVCLCLCLALSLPSFSLSSTLPVDLLSLSVCLSVCMYIPTGMHTHTL